MAGELDPNQIAELNISRRRIRERFDLGNQQLDWQSQVATREHGRGLGDLAELYRRSREGVQYNAAARGISNSGIYARGLHELGSNLGRNVSNLQGRLQDSLQGFDLARQQLTTQRASGLSDIDEIESARIQAVAAALRAAGIGA